MGQPATQSRASSVVRLAKDGANLAEYLNDIRDRDLSAFEGILEALRYVLPYAADLQPTLTSELERAFYLKLKEQDFEVPGWLLSTGTLRIVALLACLRHPSHRPFSWSRRSRTAWTRERSTSLSKRFVPPSTRERRRSS